MIEIGTLVRWRDGDIGMVIEIIRPMDVALKPTESNGSRAEWECCRLGSSR